MVAEQLHKSDLPVTFTKNQDLSVTFTMKLPSDAFKGIDEVKVTLSPELLDKLKAISRGEAGTMWNLPQDQAATRFFQKFLSNKVRSEILGGLSPKLREKVQAAYDAHQSSIERSFVGVITTIMESEGTITGTGFSYNPNTKHLTIQLPPSITNLGIASEYVRANGSTVDLDLSNDLTRSRFSSSPEDLNIYLSALISKRITGSMQSALKEKLMVQLQPTVTDIVEKVSPLL